MKLFIREKGLTCQDLQPCNITFNASISIHIFVLDISSLARHVLPDVADFILHVGDVPLYNSDPGVCVACHIVGVAGAHEVFLQEIM
ncbi:hypothetical protein HanIR_Chr06g0277371 [Helianthus annuus]|nr:hypothetical protein HanIR_Chr06g0277371 [Helianthus annuus]